MNLRKRECAVGEEWMIEIKVTNEYWTTMNKDNIRLESI